MSAEGLLDYVLVELTKAKVIYSQHLIEGGVKEFSEYTSLCGVIKGLEMATQIITSGMEQAEKNDE